MGVGTGVSKLTGSKFEVVFTLVGMSIGTGCFRALGDGAGWGVEELA